MRHYRVLKILLLIVFLASCRSTKSTIESHTTTVNDSIKLSSIIRTDTVKSVIKTIYVPGVASLNINSPCDSLGNLKPVNLSTSAGNFKATIISQGNTLKLKVQEIDSLVSVNSYFKITQKTKDSIIRNLKSKITSTKATKIIKYKWSKYTYIFLLWAIVATLLIFKNPINFLKNMSQK